MRKSLVIVAIVFSVVAVSGKNPAQSQPEDQADGRDSQLLTLRLGTNVHRPTPDPFGALPFPFGLSYEHRIGSDWGIGTSLMFDRWCDYLGMFGGKYAFRVFKPSLDMIYHIPLGKPGGFDLFAGAHLGYSFFWITNEMDNDYEGGLRHEPYFAPFAGAAFRLGKSGPGIMRRFSMTAAVAWSVTGRLSGLYGTVGLAIRLK